MFRIIIIQLTQFQLYGKICRNCILNLNYSKTIYSKRMSLAHSIFKVKHIAAISRMEIGNRTLINDFHYH